MTQENNRSFSQKWKERQGRKQIAEPVQFADTEILTYPLKFRILTTGYYLSLPPRTAAIITTPTNHKQVYKEGGYKELQAGAYLIQFVDLRDRSVVLPRIFANTKDGAEVSFTVSISYKVTDPEQIVEIDKPLQTLLEVCDAGIKNLITTHYHAELISEPGDTEYLSDHKIAQFIKEHVVMNQSCRAFWLMNVIIKERHGNPEINKLKHSGLVQEKENLTKLQNVTQQQGIAKEQKTLEKTKAEQEGMIQEIQALSKAEQSEILEHANRLQIELEHLEKLPAMQHKQTLEKIHAVEKLLQAFIQTQITTGVPRDSNQGQILESLIKSLTEVQNISPQIPEERSKSVNELRSTIINLVSPKK